MAQLDRRSGLLLAVVVVSLGAAVFIGVGPAPGGTPDAEPDSDGVSTDAESDATDEPAAFAFAVEEIDDCGQTCRDVTATVDNTQDEPASDVTVQTRIFAGENNTETGDLVWENTETIGTLDADSSHTSTQRVELSLQEAAKIEGNDGWITIVTTIESDEETTTVRESRQVG